MIHPHPLVKWGAQGSGEEEEGEEKGEDFGSSTRDTPQRSSRAQLNFVVVVNVGSACLPRCDCDDLSPRALFGSAHPYFQESNRHVLVSNRIFGDPILL